jgi:hypothetical protein
VVVGCAAQDGHLVALSVEAVKKESFPSVSSGQVDVRESADAVSRVPTIRSLTGSRSTSRSPR